MKNQSIGFNCRLVFLAMVLTNCLTPWQVYCQTPFQIVWGMNGNLSGSSSSSNFSPDDAYLVGAHPHSLPAVLYYSIGGGDFAYGTTYWLAGPEKYLNFSYSVSTYEYNLNSVSFRVRRSGEGPKDVFLRSSIDGFAGNLTSFHLNTDGVFYNVTVPLGLANLSSGVTFRIYGNNADTYLGVLYFDQIVINGTVTSIVLPVGLTYFKATPIGKTVKLEWETSFEMNSKSFIIERSNDLNTFEAIGTVDASRESTDKQQYRFVDDGPSPGVNYYRLRMVDQNEDFNYSKTVDAVIYAENPLFTVSPNPSFPTQIRVKNSLINPDEIVLTNILGQNIDIGTTTTDGNFMDLFPNQALCSGIYVLSLKLNGRWQRQKVLIP